MTSVSLVSSSILIRVPRRTPMDSTQSLPLVPRFPGRDGTGEAEQPSSKLRDPVPYGDDDDPSEDESDGNRNARERDPSRRDWLDQSPGRLLTRGSRKTYTSRAKLPALSRPITRPVISSRTMRLPRLPRKHREPL